ncbi:DUF4124 domain-containing protein [Vibrio kasasachensis]|uniref:DUF4124 domain-containing protein n=1 Tax=Vibrio kasasachensis TaxID=2910248 RepID=UPI003D1193C6
MTKPILLWALLYLMIPTQIFAQVAYTWVDTNEVRHFSDTPDSHKAKLIELPVFHQPPSISNNTEPSPSEPTKVKPDKLEPLALTFLTPEHDQVIRSNHGNLTIEVQLSRPATPGTKFQLWFDNQPHLPVQTSTAWQLKNIDRGTHQIQIKVIQDGKQIASSSLITVHLQRTTINKT